MQQLDISSALKQLSHGSLGERLFDIDIATIGLRFLHHTVFLQKHNLLEISAQSASTLDHFYKKCEESLAVALDTSNYDALLKVDTISLILGILCLKDNEPRERFLLRYLSLLVDVKHKGISPISPQRLSLLKALLQASAISLPSTLIATLITENEELPQRLPEQAVDLLEHVLIATQFGSRTITGSAQQLLVQLAKPMAMNAVRDNDMAGVAAIMVATELAGYRNYLEPDYQIWLLRQRREDGLFGNWELEGSSTPSALLLSTMFAYWAQNYVSKDVSEAPVTVYPGLHGSVLTKHLDLSDFDQSCLVSGAELEQKCFNICQWLDRNIEGFTIDISQHNKMEMTDRIKPAVEMFLTTYLILETFKEDTENPLYQWAKNRAGYLYERMPWAAMIEYFRANLSTSLGLLLFPLAARSAGKPIPYEQDIRAILSNRYSLAQERPPMRKMDFCFLARLMDIKLADIPSLTEQYQATLLAQDIHPLWFSISSLYDITHTIFYGTDFGQQQTSVTKLAKNWNEQYLRDLAIDSMLRGDLDLAGEFILCCFYTNTKAGNKFSFICKAFTDSVPDVGPVKGPDLHLRPNLDEFEACYHTCLVTVAALAEIWNVALEQNLSPYQEHLWNRLSIPLSSQTDTPTSNIEPKYIAETLLQREVEACQLVVSRQDKQTFLVADQQAQHYIMSLYTRDLDYLNIKETSNLYNDAVAQGLAFGKLSVIRLPNIASGFVTLREYTKGESLYLSAGKQHFTMLGAFIYHFHHKLVIKVHYALRNILQEWITSLSSDVCAEVPASVIQRIAYTVPTSYKVIHGDLNSTNLIFDQDTMDVYAIDFDNLGIGLPEQELALALLNENRGAEQFQVSKQQLVSAYQAEGGHLDLDLLDAFIITAPAYVLATETRKQGKVPGMLVVDRCRSQIQDRLKVCFCSSAAP